MSSGSTARRHLILLADRSGSILSILSDMQGGLRQFLAEQAAVPGITTASLYEFDTACERLRSFAPLADLEDYMIVPRGGTALLDAIGYAVATENASIAALPAAERPGTVIMLICTDGHENASRQYTRAQIRTLTGQQQDAHGWVFIYNGANQDAFAEAGSLGIPSATTVSYTAQGTSAAWASASSMVTRGNASGTYGYTPGERAAASGTTGP